MRHYSMHPLLQPVGKDKLSGFALPVDLKQVGILSIELVKAGMRLLDPVLDVHHPERLLAQLVAACHERAGRGERFS